ncbi:MAG: efflux RND transporter permease subunit, partial [Xanthomonadales bacterium]|nr:efflux RND transporter permease subunit [Xanthomonadales bacterium]
DENRGYAFTRLLSLSWSGPGAPDTLLLGRYARELATRLRAVPGMDLVRNYGAPEEEILVTIDPVLAANAGLAIGDIAHAIETRDAKVAAGQLRGGDREWLLEVSGELDSLNSLGATVLRETEDGRALRLRDIAQIQRSARTPLASQALVDGEASVVVGARMLPDVRIEDWSAGVDRVLADFDALLPANMARGTLFDQQRYTSERLGGLVANVLLGFLVILSVLFLTLGWRAALLVAFALPLTVAFTLACLRIYGLPIHQMSVTGLVVALGIMVDNAIVMTDTIQRYLRQGHGRAESVRRALRHLWAPLAGSTLTTMLAFLPIAIMPGPSGEFVGGIAISVIFALLGSYLISHTLVAGLAGRFLRPGDKRDGLQIPALARRFRALLGWVLDRPRSAIALALVLPLAGFGLAGQMAEQFFPPSDRDMFTVEVHLDSAASLQSTRALVDAIDPLIRAQDGTEQVQWFLGGSAPSFYYNMMQRYDQRPNFAHAMVRVRDFRAANAAIPKLQETLDDAFPGAQILVRKLEQGPPFNAPVELRVYGPQTALLAELGDELRARLLMTEDVIHARATLTRGRPKIRLEADENQVRRAGLAPVVLATQLQSMLDGQVAGSILEGTEELPVRVRLHEQLRRHPADLLQLHVAGSGMDRAIPLDSLVRPVIEPAAGTITRRGGERVNTIEAYLRADVLPAVVLARLQAQLDSDPLALPPGYRLEVGGESEKRDSAVGNLLGSAGLILILLVMTVVLSFNSFRLSSIIFAVAGLSAGLGLLSVWASGYPFGFVVIVGLMGLVGLAINAAIVILAELKSQRLSARGDRQAMIEGVMNCTRHIGSTTLTTLGGFMPLILDGGGFWPPFAIAIAGGTVLTSVLSFLFVPAAFRLYALRTPFELSAPSAELAYS